MEGEAGSPGLSVPASLLFVAFCRKQGCRSELLRRELRQLEAAFATDWGFGCCEEDAGDAVRLQADGSGPENPIQMHLFGEQPAIPHLRPVGLVDQDLLAVASELIHMADQLDRDVMTRAAETLHRNLSTSADSQGWGVHLSQAVDVLVKQGFPVLEQLQQERVCLALTLSLVKRVCERTPSLLQDLLWIVQELHN